MKHHWMLRLVAGITATVWALCTLPACGDCVDKTGPVKMCFSWPEAQECPTDEQVILKECRKQDADTEFVAVPDTTGVRDSSNPPECCYFVDINYRDCGYHSVAGT